MSQGLRIAHVDHCVLLGPARGSRGPGGLAVEGWGSRGAGYLLLFRATIGCGKKRAVSRAGKQGPKGSADHYLPLKLDQSEKSEVLRGSGSGLTTSSIWRKEPVSPACSMLSLPTHLAQVGPRADGQSDTDSHQRKAQSCPGPVDHGQLLSQCGSNRTSQVGWGEDGATADGALVASRSCVTG